MDASVTQDGWCVRLGLEPTSKVSGVWGRLGRALGTRLWQPEELPSMRKRYITSRF